ncbi:hypothetical protein FNV43_RR18619 [Rhamnella rubrinervis]|uniref:Uncharacterized protein n=1 Tax=Rhamnella rubrinervis TaxID=2594499 RepID=A0A8K0GY36_9ROSA|nr:hypothetical protein FNV43_RR18619 [Rhamnella rubrinervis]
MVKTGLRGNDTAMVNVLSACSWSARLNEGGSIHGYLNRSFFRLYDKMVGRTNSKEKPDSTKGLRRAEVLFPNELEFFAPVLMRVYWRKAEITSAK